MDESDQDTYRAEGDRDTLDQMVRQHVYVINGSPEFLDITRQLLQKETYNVTTTNFMPLSFDAIQATQPTLLLIDLNLGEKAGWALLARLRHAASTRDIPILLVSTKLELMRQAQDRYRASHRDQYLLTLLNLNDLLLIVEDMIERA